MELMQRLRLAYRVLHPRNRVDSWTHTQLQDAGLFDTDSDYGGALGTDLAEISLVVSSQGDSGFSRMMKVGLLKELLLGNPIAPIHDREEDWVKIGDNDFQHRKNYAVFKGRFPRPYDLDAVAVTDGASASINIYTMFAGQIKAFPYIRGQKELVRRLSFRYFSMVVAYEWWDFWRVK